MVCTNTQGHGEAALGTFTTPSSWNGYASQILLPAPPHPHHPTKFSMLLIRSFHQQFVLQQPIRLFAPRIINWWWFSHKDKKWMCRYCLWEMAWPFLARARLTFSTPASSSIHLALNLDYYHHIMCSCVCMYVCRVLRWQSPISFLLSLNSVAGWNSTLLNLARAWLACGPTLPRLLFPALDYITRFESGMEFRPIGSGQRTDWWKRLDGHRGLI